MSVLWPSKYAKIRFRPGLCPGLRWRSSRRSPRPLSRLERRHSSLYTTLLGTDPPSALAIRPPPEVQPMAYAYGPAGSRDSRHHCGSHSSVVSSTGPDHLSHHVVVSYRNLFTNSIAWLRYSSFCFTLIRTYTCEKNCLFIIDP